MRVGRHAATCPRDGVLVPPGAACVRLLQQVERGLGGSTTVLKQLCRDTDTGAMSGTARDRVLDVLVRLPTFGTCRRLHRAGSLPEALVPLLAVAGVALPLLPLGLLLGLDPLVALGSLALAVAVGCLLVVPVQRVVRRARDLYVRLNSCDRCSAYKSYYCSDRQLVDEYQTVVYRTARAHTNGTVQHRGPHGSYGHSDTVQTQTTSTVPVTVTQRVWRDTYTCSSCGQTKTKQRIQTMG